MKNTGIAILLFLAMVMGSLFQTQAQVPTQTSQATAQNRLTREQMQKDFVVLKSTFEQLHPALYKYNTVAQMQENFATLAKKIDVNSMEIKEFYVLLAEFVNKIRCGHTFLNPLNLKEETTAKLFANNNLPFYFQVVGKNIFITHNLSSFEAIKAGDEIIEIDGIKSQSIINQLLTVSRSDGNNAMGKKISNLSLLPEEDYGYALFDIFFPLYFGDKASRKIVVKHFEGKTKTYTVPCMKQEDRSKKYEAKFGKIPKEKETWTYTKPTAQTAVLKFGTFAFWNSKFDYQTYLDSVFTLIGAEKEIKNLVVDLRGNEGGSGDIRNEILSYLTSKTLQYESTSKICYRYLSIPDSVKKNLTTWDRSFAAPKNAADFTLNELGLYEKKATETEDLIQPKAKSFKGNIFLLTNAANSSATFSFAWTFQYNKLGTIVGETTGGTKQGLNGGEMFFLNLPNSAIEIDLPLIYYYQKNMPDEGVKPEKEVKISQKDIANGKDAVMDYVLKSLGSK